MTLRVFHILTESEPFSRFHGGAISRWVANVTAQDSDPVVLCPETDGTWNFPAERVRPLPQIRLQTRITKRLGRGIPQIANAPLLRWALKQGLEDIQERDIVWIHNRPNFAAAITPFVRKRQGKVVLHLHNSHVAQSSPRVLRQLHSDWTLFCSAWLEAEAVAAWPGLGRTSPIPNGADDGLFYPAAAGRMRNPEGPLALLFVGRLVPEKGPHVLIEAMRLLEQRRVPVRARIAGSATFGNNASTEYVQDLHRNAPGNVEFLGYSDPQTLGERFREADIFCCPSTWNEPFGMINVEAMATRLPVIATRCGGIPEIFSEGGAILVEPGSAVAIADACERLAGDPGLRERLAAEGYASYLRNYTWRAVHRKYREIVEGLWA